MAKLDDQGHGDEGLLASVNIVPFVDIVLVLLVIFMLTSAAIVKASLKVELPKAASAGAKVQSTLNLVYTKQGELFVNGDRVADLAAAAGIVRAEVGKDPATQAVIAADEGVLYGKVIEIVDMVKGSGVKTFALDLERKAKDPIPGGAP
ncbi:MAG TPA: biopolymer transporter ExbD [Polyangiaceae bacterium]|nr:biopolymer transporter ExbD [Polyangiaceae bacterium]